MINDMNFRTLSCTVQKNEQKSRSLKTHLGCNGSLVFGNVSNHLYGMPMASFIPEFPQIVFCDAVWTPQNLETSKSFTLLLQCYILYSLISVSGLFYLSVTTYLQARQGTVVDTRIGPPSFKRAC